MFPTLLAAFALAAGSGTNDTLAVTFPDQGNPNYYHVMSCHGAWHTGASVHIGRDGVPTPKKGRVVYRCDGPLTTTIERIPFEPPHFRDTAWSWSFESADGKVLLAGAGAKLMRMPARGLRLYVREGYRDP